MRKTDYPSVVHWGCGEDVADTTPGVDLVRKLRGDINKLLADKIKLQEEKMKGVGIGDINSEDRGTGARYNAGKVEYSLIPMSAMESCARVFMYGRKKYKAWNWAKGMDWLVPYDCLMRHLEAWHRGEDVDGESGELHLGHAMANLVMLCFFAKFFPEGDNRPPKHLFGVGSQNQATKMSGKVGKIGKMR